MKHLLIFILAAGFTALCAADRRGTLSAVRSASGGGGISDPTAISGLHLWVKADGSLSNEFNLAPGNGGSVVIWKDASGNGRDLTHALSGSPNLVSSWRNGLPGVTFAGTDNLRIGFSSLASCTVFAVVKHAATGSFGFIYDSTNGSARCALYKNGSEVLNTYSGTGDVGGTTLSGGSFYIACSVHNGSGTDENWVNGSQVATGSSGNQGLDGLTLGARNDEVQAYGGDIGEFIIYNRVLNSTEIGQVFTYLNSASRWNAIY